MNVKLTLPIAAAVAIVSVVVGGGRTGSDVTSSVVTSCYVSRLTSLPALAPAGAPAARRVPVWRPGC